MKSQLKRPWQRALFLSPDDWCCGGKAIGVLLCFWRWLACLKAITAETSFLFVFASQGDTLRQIKSNPVLSSKIGLAINDLLTAKKPCGYFYSEIILYKSFSFWDTTRFPSVVPWFKALLCYHKARTILKVTIHIFLENDDKGNFVFFAGARVK